MKKNNDNIKFRPLPLLAALAWMAALMALQFLLPLPEFPAGWFLALLLLMTVFSVAVTVRRERHEAGMSYDEIEAALAEAKKQAQASMKDFAAGLTMDLLFRWVWLGVSVLFASAAVLFSDITVTTFGSVFTDVIALWYLWGLFSVALPRSTEDVPEGAPLTRAEYPNLFKTIDRVFPDGHAAAVCPGGETFGLYRDGKKRTIVLGAFEYSVMNEDEIYALLLQERWFTENPLVRTGHRARAFREISPASAGCPLLLLSDALMQYPQSRLTRNCYLWDVISDTELIRLVLEEIRKNGCSRDYLTGLAKVRMLGLFDVMEPEAHVPFYAGETVPQAPVSAELACFRSLYEKRKRLWYDLLKNETDGWNGISMSYPEFCRALGEEVPEAVLNPGTDAERTACAKAADAVMVRHSETTYEADRNRCYLKPKSVLDRYEQETAEGKTYSVLEMRPVLDACLTLDRTEELIRLCDDTVARSSNSDECAHARFLLGKALLYRYDRSGLDEVLVAMDSNENYIREGGELIERFAMLFGMKEELPRYMERVKEITELAAEHNTLIPSAITPMDQLSAEDTLPDSVAAENAEFIRNACGEHLLGLWALHRLLSDTYGSTVYILEFDAEITDEEKTQMFEKVYHYLDSLPRQYSFFERKEMRGIDPERYKGSCVWHR